MFELRRALPRAESFIDTGGHALTWFADAPYTLDVATFEAVARQAPTAAALAQAVDLYAGELLPGCDDDWIVPDLVG